MHSQLFFGIFEAGQVAGETVVRDEVLNVGVERASEVVDEMVATCEQIFPVPAPDSVYWFVLKDFSQVAENAFSDFLEVRRAGARGNSVECVSYLLRNTAGQPLTLKTNWSKAPAQLSLHPGLS